MKYKKTVYNCYEVKIGIAFQRKMIYYRYCLNIKNGDIAQLGERFAGSEEVVGSRPIISILIKR